MVIFLYCVAQKKKIETLFFKDYFMSCVWFLFSDSICQCTMLMCRTSNMLHKFSCSTIMIDLIITSNCRNANNLNSIFCCQFAFEKIKLSKFYLSKKVLLLCSEKIKEPVTPSVTVFRFYSKKSNKSGQTAQTADRVNH